MATSVRLISAVLPFFSFNAFLIPWKNDFPSIPFHLILSFTYLKILVILSTSPEAPTNNSSNSSSNELDLSDVISQEAITDINFVNTTLTDLAKIQENHNIDIFLTL